MNEKAKNIKDTKDKQAIVQKSKDVKKRPESKLEFFLVICMLISLTLLVILLIVLPIIVKDQKEFIDYSKWVLTALLGAFGAWIGAGAAYFFGKENLRLSSESTKEALEIQKDSLKDRSELALIKDINLTPFNPSFIFSLDSDVKETLDKLGENVDYWFVPVVEKERLKDTIHTEAFWRYFKTEYEEKKKKEEPKIKDVIEYIDTSKELEQKRKKLHGFFLEAKMGDLVKDISDMMDRKDASVGIVCDKEGRPTHCFSRKDLRSFQLGSS